MAGPLPLNALNAFVVAARHGSFSKAADELNVTPAAVSQQIRSLEELLGVQLFHRLNRGLALTDAGQAGLGQLKDGFHNISQAIESIKSGDAKRDLNIWMAPSFASKWLMPRMQRFIEKHPSIDLRTETLKEHNVDVAIRFGSGNYPGCQVERLMDVDAMPLCSPSLLADSANLPLSCCYMMRHPMKVGPSGQVGWTPRGLVATWLRITCISIVCHWHWLRPLKGRV